ncbi:MAG TPA: glycohydrolase toxin TNT-related protein [Streptosporangiaceae bacterium]|nr:glycohydrolase toxin TNT-related protein [Streptosporangiaceae bacterium]
MVVSEQELLNPTEQDVVLQDIALVLAHNLPPGWQECLVTHHALGAHTETTVRIERLNGPPTDVSGPEVLGELLARLRTGMYRPGVGTWFSARFRLTHPVDYRIEYDNTGRPDWSAPPPDEAYADEARMFPRAPEHVPGWLRDRARDSDDTPEDRPRGDEGAPAEATTPRFQMARVFDSLGPGQTPQLNRPPVPDDEVEAVADYLTKAPLVLAARSLDNDLLDPARPEKVPLTYLTDGTWIWPGGVGYYLRTHGVPPEPELVDHIRRQGFQPPEVDDYTRDVAVAAIMGQPPPPTPEPAPANEPSPSMAPPEPAQPPSAAGEPGPSGVASPPTPRERTPSAESPAAADPLAHPPVMGSPGLASSPLGPLSSAAGEPDQRGVAPPAASSEPEASSPIQPSAAASPLASPPLMGSPGLASSPLGPSSSAAGEPGPSGVASPAATGERTPSAESPGAASSEPEASSPIRPPAAAGPLASPEPASFEPASSPHGPPSSADQPGVASPTMPGERKQNAEPATAAPEPVPSMAPAAESATRVDAGVDRDRQALQRLRARLTELGVDPESYGIEIIIPDAWCLVREGAGWAVFRTAGGDRAVNLAFPVAEQAAAFLLGVLLMGAGQPPAPAASSVTKLDLRRPARRYDGPIAPLPGEPPVTLFRNLRELELVAGTEVDRIGDPGGNLTYAAGTHYSQRSLPPEWENRPYHVYRLQQSLRVLIGTAVPWFDQPGGGTGYFLPVSIAELLADGALVEVEPAPL